MNITIGINTINAQFVHDKWMNQASVSFVSKYTRLVSNTKKSILDKIKDDPSKLFALLNKSDIVWALLIYVNNKEYWEAVLTKKAAKKKLGFLAYEATGRTPKRGRPSANILPVPGTGKDGIRDEGIEEDPQTKIKQ